jgi:putative MATE family efflux protein
MLKPKQIDATRGPLVSQIIIFAVPLILTTLIQTLFNAVDIAVLGNMADTRAVAAVGATTTVVHLIVDAFVGIASGAKIVLARLIGKNDEQELRRTIDTSIVLAIGFGVFVAVVGIFSAPFLMRWVKCPTECFDDAVLYIRLYLSVAPAILLYNYGSAVLTSSGDTQRPLYYAIASGFLNVVLNVVLCFILSRKVAAVAIATAASQVLAALLVMIRLCRMEGALRVRILRVRFYFSSFVQLLRFGVPLALQTLIYPLTNLQIASAINSHGVACMAGNSASVTVEQMTSAFRNAFGSSAGTFIGQNLGAEKPDRVRKSLWHNLWLVLVVNTIVSTLVMLTNTYWLKLFLKDDVAAMEYAIARNTLLMIASFFPAITAVLGHAIQAYGYPVFSTVNAVLWVLGFRVIWMAFIYPLYPTYTSLVQCFVVSWGMTTVCNVVIFAIIYARYKRGKYKRI